MTRIFVCYRHEDTVDGIDRMCDHLKTKFGNDSVFLDVTTIPAGQDFNAVIRRHIEHSDVQLVVIGTKWCDLVDQVGRRRLDDANDPVVMEIEAATRDGVPIIPVLLHGASMPPEDALPPSIRQLAAIQAISLRYRDPGFKEDIPKLYRAIRLRRISPRRRQIIRFRQRVRIRLRTQRTRRAALIGLAATLVLVSSVAALGVQLRNLGARGTSHSPTATATFTATATITEPTIAPALSLHPIRIAIQIDYAGLLNGDPSAIAAAEREVKANSQLTGRRAALVDTFGGANPDTGLALEIARTFDSKVLSDLGIQGFVFTAAVYREFFSLGVDPGTVTCDVYVFKS